MFTSGSSATDDPPRRTSVFRAAAKLLAHAECNRLHAHDADRQRWFAQKRCCRTRKSPEPTTVNLVNTNGSFLLKDVKVNGPSAFAQNRIEEEHKELPHCIPSTQAFHCPYCQHAWGVKQERPNDAA